MIAICRRRPKPKAGRIWLITGPNMAGKSTFLRQNALIAILAQMGSFVPAKSARIGVVDRLFSRVGAADDLARGRSTFMVEMVETAAILNQAGARALVILDEIGRGTATFDGLSIAWATVEHLHDVNNCRALFATHFHELTALAARLPRLHNATVKVKEWQGEVVFLHEVTAGAADRSYGIQVAKLAGLPQSVIERAKVVLAKLEQEDRAAPKGFEDLPLFAAPYKPSAEMQEAAHDLLAAAIAALNPDDMSPRDAMEALYRLKEQLAKTPKDVMMNIAERKQTSALADAQGWLAQFEAALQTQDAAAAAALFLADGLWRDLLAFTWTIQTMAGRAAIETTLRETLARTKPKNFRIPPQRTPPRWVSRAGTDAIEVLFDFETAFGPCNGVLRLVPDDQGQLRAWTLNTNLHELRGHEEEFKRRAPPDSTRDFGAENWTDRLKKQREFADRDPGGAGGRRRPGGAFDCRAARPARHRYADRRPPHPRRRQLAHALPLADAAQRGVRQSPALSAVPAEFSGLYPEGQARQLVRILRRRHGAEFLDRHRARRRQL